MRSYLAAVAASAVAPSGMDLAMRDPARAAAFGLFGGDSRSSTFGDDFPTNFGADTALAREYGQGGEGRGWGDKEVNMQAFRNLATQDVNRGREVRHESAALERLEALERKLARMHARTQERRELIEPNAGSGIDVGRLMFPISQNIPLLGAPSVFVNFYGQPDTTIKPERIAMNAPVYGFVLVQDVKVKNVSAIIGNQTDAAFFSGTAVGMHVSLPKLTPSNKLTVYAAYTGAVPPGYAIGAYPFVVQAIGPAIVTGNDRIEDD